MKCRLREVLVIKRILLIQIFGKFLFPLSYLTFPLYYEYIRDAFIALYSRP